MKLSAIWQQLVAYVRFRIRAGNAHGLHSPFVYLLYTEALAVRKHYYAFDRVEALREMLLRSDTKVHVTDLGAGSRVSKSKVRKVASIARHSARNPCQAQILFRLACFLDSDPVLEIGTSLGIQTAYFGFALPKAKIMTLEGCPETAAIARQNFQELGLHQVKLVEGDFKDTLGIALQDLGKVGLVLFDGNHSYGPTMDYFHECLPHTTKSSCFIFDDIHWSEGMENAWAAIVAHPQVTISIDCFHFGLVFFREKQPKQHFLLRV